MCSPRKREVRMTRPHSLAYRVADRLDVFAPAVSLAGPDCHAKSNNKFPPVQASSRATDVLRTRMAAASSMQRTTIIAATLDHSRSVKSRSFGRDVDVFL